jgi:hypothetical protein
MIDRFQTPFFVRSHQIVQSVTWSIDVNFPSPFTEMMSALSIFSFDFLSLECLFKNSNHLLSVYLWSATPVAIAVLLVVAHFIQRGSGGAAKLANRLLLLGFLALPPVALKLFQALDCVEIAKKRYLRIDTSIDCDTAQFRMFTVLDSLFIAFYMAIPLLWLTLLWLNRDRLNPSSTAGSDKKHALFLRDNDEGLVPLRFLFAAYKPSFYFAETVEM